MEKRLVLNTLLLKVWSCISHKFLLSCGTNVYANYPDEFFCGYVDMFKWSSVSTASFIASQQLQMKAIIHSTEIPLHSTLVFSPSKILILFNNPLVSDKEISETNNSKTATSRNIARATKTWMARMVLSQKHIDLMNKSASRCAVVRFCYHSYDYRPNWASLSPYTITYQNVNSLCAHHHYVNRSCKFCVTIELQKLSTNQRAYFLRTVF